MALGLPRAPCAGPVLLLVLAVLAPRQSPPLCLSFMAVLSEQVLIPSTQILRGHVVGLVVPSLVEEGWSSAVIIATGAMNTPRPSPPSWQCLQPGPSC